MLHSCITVVVKSYDSDFLIKEPCNSIDQKKHINSRTQEIWFLEHFQPRLLILKKKQIHKQANKKHKKKLSKLLLLGSFLQKSDKCWLSHEVTFHQFVLLKKS